MVLRPGCGLATGTHNLELHARTTTCKPKRHVPHVATICITLELLMTGIMVPEICWADNKFSIKTILLHPVGYLFPRINLTVNNFSTFIATQNAYVFVDSNALSNQSELHTRSYKLFFTHNGRRYHVPKIDLSFGITLYSTADWSFSIQFYRINVVSSSYSAENTLG
jgi:hypothetical protein